MYTGVFSKAREIDTLWLSSTEFYRKKLTRAVDEKRIDDDDPLKPRHRGRESETARR